MRLKSHSLKALLNGNAVLKHLTASARQMQQLHDRVCLRLPSSLSGHCLGVRQQADTLVIYMDSAASATLLRYQQRQLMSQLASVLPSCNHIKVQVLPESPPARTSKPVAHVLPETVRAMLESTAAELEDGQLRRSLRNLARGRNHRK
jgi:hypothetical protein